MVMNFGPICNISIYPFILNYIITDTKLKKEFFVFLIILISVESSRYFDTIPITFLYIVSYMKVRNDAKVS